MARTPDGWIITVEADSHDVQLHDSRELITCKNCWKDGKAICPMGYYWDIRPVEADDDCFCAMAEQRESE